ncbi:hypothetical protein [uncultured Aquimarina sp.]|uniref:DUF6892 domain-containing protein n=1 Tax=uncultured Aquimarina sp. TaxID=575652 RepID=UPI00263A22C1|nr:hypothetical protein [uncultured Aquimarina sp.]
MINIKLIENSFLINNISVSFPISFKSLHEILKVPYRVYKKKYNTIYTWDDLGILGYSKDQQHIDSIYLELQKEDFDFTPKQLFTGSFLFKNQDAISYYKEHKNKRIQLFEGDTSGALVLNDISVWFSTDQASIEAIEIKSYQGTSIKQIPKDKYIIRKLDEEEIIFTDFGFKLAIVQELMYSKEFIQPKFDLFEFVLWYSKREIDLEEEGYDPIEEVTQYFRDLPIPKRLASEVTEIYQDGGNDIYLNLIRFAEGWEDYWDIENIEDVTKFPNLKKVTLCYAKEHIIPDLKKMGVDAEWL